ncbi:hypothetical protein RHSIM_Rhsim09G0090600 [Rhododendron simsii]|uniref:Non-haem dioxygenase N-terminal domain-containing protein n=1 Tax=Rhododendron simsii TaxID=118357 RepID=A0A834LEH4_RHOSS|nr:hypothetical protein RHSIM_Rhsim09G0090600 [Rhododendron simsii]
MAEMAVYRRRGGGGYRQKEEAVMAVGDGGAERPIPHTRPTHTHHLIPIVDFSAPKPILTDQITRAASTIGFFQITNHGIPLHVIQRTLATVKSFNELPAEIKTSHYHREMGRGVTFSTNVDLYQ